MTKDNIVNFIEEKDFKDAISERYLAYALSTIMSRSLPSVRDGLKPVHRRILFAMHQLKLDPKSSFKKCARVVGDVIGKYHPHGDVAVYDTLVRLAQDFSVRYPLIIGQGNFGSVDGDNAAAMRYTESKLSEVATFLLNDLEKDTVDFRANYDGSESEPELLPAAFPNLLANGSEGIAVGMATSIPPHNLEELCQACLLIAKKPNVTNDELLEIVEGPDLPTGGIIMSTPAEIKNIYETGRGSLRVRARWEVQNLSHGLYQIIITEIPYQVQKSKLIERIADLIKDRKVPLISNIRDESTSDIRIILEPRNRQVEPELIMSSLFKLSDLESRININMNVLDRNTIPRLMNLKEILSEFVSFRKEVIVRRAKYRLEQVDNRLHILEGLNIVYLNLDEVIKIVRFSEKPKDELMSRFGLSDVQAEAILNTRLRSLSKLEEHAIISEINNLKLEKGDLEEIISSDQRCISEVSKELKNIIKLFGKNTDLGKRRTSFEEDKEIGTVINVEAFVQREPITIICSEKGWIRAIKGHSDDMEAVKYKEGDQEKFILHAYTTDNILVFSSRGKFYTIFADNITKGKGFGESIRLMVDMQINEEIVDLKVYNPDQKLLLASSNGKGFIVVSKDVLASTKGGKQVMSVPDKVKASICHIINGNMVAAVGTNRKLIIFTLEEIPEMKKGQGVTLQKYKDATLSDIKTFNKEEGLTWVNGTRNYKEEDISLWHTKRGGIGKLPPAGFPRTNVFVQ